jgi:sugar (pentulose or hexulose) kinase
MFPVDIETGGFDQERLEQFDGHISGRGFGWKLRDLLPEVLPAGEPAGELTEEGARLLDPEGHLEAGVPLCPPEGDAGTGMVATNSVEVRTGNVSAGTSVFAMLVLEKELSRLHSDIDLVTTPDGKLVAMAHSNNCTSDLNAWMDILRETVQVFGVEADPGAVFEKILPLALKGDADGGGLLSYAFVSGEHVMDLTEGRPLFVRSPEARFTLANFVRTHLFSALCALRKGLNILFEEEGVKVDEIRGHGGFFKTPEVGERIMAAATGVPVSVLQTAGEGGAWGMALLAAYRSRPDRSVSLTEFLQPVFAGSMGSPVPPDPADAAGFDRFFERHRQGLAIEKAAVEYLRS